MSQFGEKAWSIVILAVQRTNSLTRRGEDCCQVARQRNPPRNLPLAPCPSELPSASAQSSAVTPYCPLSYRVPIGTPRFSAMRPMSCCPMSLMSLYSLRRRMCDCTVSSAGWLVDERQQASAAFRGAVWRWGFVLPQPRAFPFCFLGDLEERHQSFLSLVKCVALRVQQPQSVWRTRGGFQFPLFTNNSDHVAEILVLRSGAVVSNPGISPSKFRLLVCVHS